MFRFDDLQKNKKHGKLKDIKPNEISYVDRPANQLEFLVVKRDSGETFNDLDELFSCESFSDEDAEIVDGIMKWLDLDDATTSAIGDLLLAVTSNTEIAKACMSDSSGVEEFVKDFVSKAEFADDEIEVIDNALEVISDLDDMSLQAVRDLLKINFLEDVVIKRWPSLFKHMSESEVGDSGQVRKTGLKWPSIVSQI